MSTPPDTMSTPADDAAADLLTLWMDPDPQARHVAVTRMLTAFYPADLLDGVDQHAVYRTVTGLLDLARDLAVQLAQARGAAPEEVAGAAFDIVRQLVAVRTERDQIAPTASS
jgi:hypothetical protein